MKKSVMQKWVKALRSGKYKQGKYKLQDGNTYCCLGVLCDISGQSTEGFDGILEGENLLFQRDVQNWAGLKSVGGKYLVKNDEYWLSNQNDSGLSFKQIANIIERQWKKL